MRESALAGKAGAVWEINASVKHGEVAMAGVRSISHTHPQTDSTDHASETSVCVCVKTPKQENATNSLLCLRKAFANSNSSLHTV